MKALFADYGPGALKGKKPDQGDGTPAGEPPEQDPADTPGVAEGADPGQGDGPFAGEPPEQDPAEPPGGTEGADPGQEGDPPIQGDLIQDFEWPVEEWKRPTFKDCAAADISAAFFNGDEHAEEHNVDGEDVLVILDKSDVRDHAAHWEAGAKQNFDTGLYNLHIILYIRVEDYGPKPKQGKRLILDQKLAYSIQKCEEESGVYRMTLERTRQG